MNNQNNNPEVQITITKNELSFIIDCILEINELYNEGDGVTIFEETRDSKMIETLNEKLGDQWKKVTE